MYSGEYDACDVTLSAYQSVWQSIGLVFQRSYVRFPPWSGIFFKLARCGYTLRVTSQASYSPEYITPIWVKESLQGSL